MSKNKNGNLIAEGMAEFLDRNKKLSFPKPKLEKKAQETTLKEGMLVSTKSDAGCIYLVKQMPTKGFDQVQLQIKKPGKAGKVDYGGGFSSGSYTIGDIIPIMLNDAKKLLLTGEMWEVKPSDKTANLKTIFNSLVSAASALNQLGFAKSSIKTMSAIESLLAQARFGMGDDEDLEDLEELYGDDDTPHESFFSDETVDAEEEDSDPDVFDPVNFDPDAGDMFNKHNHSPSSLDDEDIDSNYSQSENEKRTDEFLGDPFFGEDNYGTEELDKPLSQHDQDLLDSTEQDEDEDEDEDEDDFSDDDDGKTKPKKSHKKKHKIDEDEITARPTGGSYFGREYEAPTFTSRKSRDDLDPEDENWFLE